MRLREKLSLGFVGCASVLGMGALLVLLTGLIVKWLWNYLCPEVLPFGEITFLQAYALLILCSLLFRSVSR
jgi:hypothetical protein